MGAVAPIVGDRHAVVLRMFNDRSPEWEVTDERVDALASIPSGMEERHITTITKMVESAVEGIKRWGLTTERFVALRQYIALIRAPTSRETRDVIRQMQLGGMRDGVADREWFRNTMKLLLNLEEES